MKVYIRRRRTYEVFEESFGQNFHVRRYDLYDRGVGVSGLMGNYVFF